MKEKEIRDQNGRTWKCVEAFSTMDEEAREKAQEKVTSENGHVPVICTPSGGEQTVRLSLPPDWMESLGEEELARRITASKN